MQQQEEQELIRRIVNGETDLYAILARRYGRVVYTLVSRIVGCPEDAEELAQDVFIKAFRSLGRFDGRSSFPTWLYRIACNTAVSETRRRKREWACIDEKRLANLPDSDAVRIEEWDGRQERLDALAHAIELLEPEERALVTLFYYEEYPVSECAQITGITESNVKVRLHRIRKKLYILVNTQLHGNET